MFVSVTRLRLRSPWIFFRFLRANSEVAKQAQVAPGFLSGRVLMSDPRTYWTLTLWKDADSMKAFRIAGAHGAVMPKLLAWCDEASVANWEQGSAELPSWEEAHRRMVEIGRPSKVSKPSKDHLSRRIPQPNTLFDNALKPKAAHSS